MRAAALLLAAAALASGQNVLTRGADLFNQTCASGYCHGARGVGGGAPRLAARGFTEEYIAQTVRRGVPGTAMPEFGSQLARADAAAIIAYVASLNGIAPSRNPMAETEQEKKLPAEAERGRALFFDAVRGFDRCATCHELDRQGIPIAAPTARVPSSVAELRRLATPRVETASAGGETFPALVLSKGSKQVKLYDLTSPPPVLRTLAPASVTLKEGSEWRHAGVVGAYQDSELESVLVFLRAVVRP
ncbi:MAG TPA: c-type cytochrome [Bryobacteraceae bacterium]|nr:c-type cytochrome [Bryobacteraceae bacterium]